MKDYERTRRLTLEAQDLHRLGWSKTAIAKKLNVSRPYVSRDLLGGSSKPIREALETAPGDQERPGIEAAHYNLYLAAIDTTEAVSLSLDPVVMRRLARGGPYSVRDPIPTHRLVATIGPPVPPTDPKDDITTLISPAGTADFMRQQLAAMIDWLWVATECWVAEHPERDAAAEFALQQRRIDGIMYAASVTYLQFLAENRWRSDQPMWRAGTAAHLDPHPRPEHRHSTKEAPINLDAALLAMRQEEAAAKARARSPFKSAHTLLASDDELSFVDTWMVNPGVKPGHAFIERDDVTFAHNRRKERDAHS
jgi:hypothetical protein